MPELNVGFIGRASIEALDSGVPLVQTYETKIATAKLVSKKLDLQTYQLSGIYEHLKLTDWPFTVIPRPELCTFIAGRPQLKADIGDMLRSLYRRDTSSIHVFWSWFGAGKTHTLYYLMNQARELNTEGKPTTFLPLYTEFPRSVRNFVDLYKSIMVAMDLSVVGDAFLELHTSPQPQSYYSKLLIANPDLAAALRVFSTGTEQQKTLATRWLRGDMVPVADFREIGISQRIATSENAIRTLSTVLNLLGAAERAKGNFGHRLIWAIDELQRVDAAGRNVIQDVNAGLHSLFNSCPTGLSLVLSFSGQPDQDSLPSWFSTELKDRMGVTKVMVMPPLQHREALLFVSDVLKQFRSASTKGVSDFFPFTEQACNSILDYVKDQGEMSPRNIMGAFNAVLEEADILLESGNTDVVDDAFVKQVLDQRVIASEQSGGSITG